MADVRIKDLNREISDFSSGDFIVVDGNIGASKMAKDSLLKVTAQNALAWDYIEQITFVKGFYIENNVDVGNVVSLSPIASGSFSYAIVDCNQGDTFVVNATGSTSGRLWSFIDENNKLLSKSSQNLVGNNLILEAPKNSVKLILNSSNIGLGYCSKGFSSLVLSKKISDVEKRTLKQIEITSSMLTAGYYCNSSASNVSSLGWNVTKFIDISDSIPGAFIKAPAHLENLASFCFCDKDFNVLSYIQGSGSNPYGNGYKGFIIEQIPQGCVYVKTSFSDDALKVFDKIIISYLSVGDVKSKLNENTTSLQAIINSEDFGSGNLWDLSNLLDGYYDASGVFHEEAIYQSCDFLDISNYDYVVCSYAANQTLPIVYDTWDSSKNILSGTRVNKAAGSEWSVKIVVSENVKYLTINTKTSYVPSIIGYKINPFKTIEDSVKKGLKGKKISILGDSISTYVGYIPPANENYYTGSNCGVTSVDQTWWKRIINYFGLTLLVNNSWSGATISSKRDGYYPGSSGVARCESLDSDGINPDIIIIYMGTNDFRNDVALGSYNGTQPFPTTWATFRDALAVMLKKVLTKYPLAQTYICSLKQFEHYGEVEGFPDTNGLGLTTDDYTKAILDIATLFGVPVIDFNKCGLNYFNLAEFCGDYSSTSGKGLHPNAAGMKRLADRVVLDIIPSIT